jgi:transposase
MARPASVFVRDLLPEEAQRLRRVSRQSKVFALRQRAQILLASDARSTAPEIARVLQTDENQVRRVIAEFNADGMVSLRPRIGGGRPRRIDDAAREEIRGIALARPRDLGEPGTRWSLTTLRRYLVRHRVVAAISKEHLRRLLGSMGITAQRTRTWKWSNDPLFEVKKSWVLAAYQAAEAGTLDGVVVSFDECGPISLKPHAGSGWFPPGSGPPTTGTAAPGSCWAPTTSVRTGCGVMSSPGRSRERSCGSSSATSGAATRPT